MATKFKKPDFTKVGDFLTKNATPILYIGGGIVIILIVSKVLKGIIGTNSLFGNSSTDTSNVDVNTSNLTISSNDALLIAEGMYSAMNRIGTDEQSLFDLVTPLNKDDLLLVIKTFGMRRYEPLLGTTAFLLGQDQNLIGWLKGELGGSSYTKMKALFDGKGVAF